MQLTRTAIVFGAIGVVTLASAMSPSVRAKRRAPLVTHEIVAVYLGTYGTDTASGMIEAVRDMKVALARQASSSGRAFIARGVSLEPSVGDGWRHLARLGPFDEVSVGGNWTNSMVVRYLGRSTTLSTARIPQVVLVERDVQDDGAMLDVSPERELARFIGAGEISAWVSRGAPLPKK